MQRIMFIIGTMGNGGAERVIAALSNELVQRGNNVRIITIYGSHQDYPLADGIELCPVICKNKMRLLRPLERIKILRNKIREFNPDCVVSFLADVNIHTIFACRNLHIPLVVSERNDPKSDPKQPWVRKMRDRVYKKAQGFVFQTPDAEDYFKPYLTDNSLKTIIPNPLTPDLPYHVFDAENTRLITACRLNTQKNLKLMIDAVSDILEEGISCNLDIFGEGPLREELRQYIESKKISEKVKLKGFSKNIHNEMVNSSAFVISSDYEGISNSMLEALAIGLPVVATDCPVGGARMFIKNGETGYLVPVRDREALKNAIKNVLLDKNSAMEMGKRAISIREVLDVKVITQKWIDYINLVIEKGVN